MPTQQIPREEWTDFLASFSAHNQTRSVVVEMENQDLGIQRVIDGKPLIAVEPDLKDEHEPTITVVAGDPEGGEPAALTHQVMNPRAIWVKQASDGEAEALDIETEDGRTIIEFV
jgi:hypothetical protein